MTGKKTPIVPQTADSQVKEKLRSKPSDPNASCKTSDAKSVKRPVCSNLIKYRRSTQRIRRSNNDHIIFNQKGSNDETKKHRKFCLFSRPLQLEYGEKNHRLNEAVCNGTTPQSACQLSNRYHVFSYTQVKRLDSMLHSDLIISPRPLSWDCVFVQPPTVYIERCKYCSPGDSSSDTIPASTSCSLPNCPCNQQSTESSGSKMPQAFKHDRSKSEHVAVRETVQCMPVLYIQVVKLVRSLRDRLLAEHIKVKEIRLNGTVAGSVIENIPEESSSDLNLIFCVDLSNPNTFAKIKTIVFSTISQFLADTFASGRIVYNCTQNRCTGSCPVLLADTAHCQADVMQPGEHVTEATKPQSVGSNQVACPANRCSGISRLVESTVDHSASPKPSSQPTSAHTKMYHPCVCCVANPSVTRTTWCSMLREEAFVRNYIQKMIRIHKPSSKTADSWSLFTLGYRTPDGGKTVDIKFVDRMQRQFEFTVDSFQIVLDSLLTFHETSRQRMNTNFYPVVVAESVSGSFSEALYHLHERLIVTARPEEIRGGGLLKYCKLLVEGYSPSPDTDVLSMERYMCSRFFIDFPDIISQHHRLNYYLVNHFDDDDSLKASYLQILHEVVSHSTVCLMGHERQQTLCLIRMFLQDVLSHKQSSQSVMPLEDFFADNWILDSVHYGTSYFPRQFVLLSDPVADSPPLTDPDVIESSGASENTDLPREDDETEQPHSHSHASITVTDTKKNAKRVCHLDRAPQNEYPTEGVQVGNKGTSLRIHAQQLSDVEEVTDTDVQSQDEMCAAIPSIINDRQNPHDSLTECTTKSAVPVKVKADSSTPVITLGQSNTTKSASAPAYIGSVEADSISPSTLCYPHKLYYIPQIVTYFPTNDYTTSPCDNTMKYTDRSTNNFLCDIDLQLPYEDPALSSVMTHYHAGIIIPQSDSTEALQMTHYVGVPSSDTQHPYSDYATGPIPEASERLCATYPANIPMYYYETDPGYFIYTDPPIPNPSTVLLAYPM